jgi:hypothetical protein
MFIIIIIICTSNMLIEDVSTTAAGRDEATAGVGTNAGVGTSAGRKISAVDAANVMFKVNCKEHVARRPSWPRFNHTVSRNC